MVEKKIRFMVRLARSPHIERVPLYVSSIDVQYLVLVAYPGEGIFWTNPRSRVGELYWAGICIPPFFQIPPTSLFGCVNFENIFIKYINSFYDYELPSHPI